ncbi:tRNA 5-methylaminomethyl-2-thiouridine biosynthesis bifunctional protein MnmC [Pigmentiphaga humi]|uniref:tRNA 5-methylaminomethyl-2-thiouridine biosynthesis bifunctional protein MnmC n=1 Tax=Pigmentiphaga humi TaxID=2478468 RepID=A0A3P4B177_9BURK|nr:FAD-dependent 5-carboxymethylaminomethyl-2-thiouridine(34) oxidoreductase MnmC [Pigmentiphaga humi]VCU70034.1 tRNA 5-methylaminomethyl-2-thiouridine biosynthesis bifunctional protein MnmC [Pigmentiphaga humi]
MIAPVFTPLIPSVPAFESGIPYSPRYGDVYHAAQGAVEQARHVFLAGNGLPQRWRGRERFTVCETGFGLGLNFLALWRAWREDPLRSRRLHVVSVEAHPFAREHLAQLLPGRLPEAWREMADRLLEKWPPLLPGLHRLDLDGGAVTLTLAFGLAAQVVPQLSLGADAFFLDGFDPACNPDMWSEGLVKGLARLAAPDATAATWTSAGAVRRALQSAGFIVDKQPGFGGKRHMTVARFAPRFERRHAPAPAPVFGERHAVVVGAGVAGAGVAHALALRGWRVTVLDPAAGEPAPRGHLAAALTPLLARDDNPRARLARAGALRAAERWTPWLDGSVVARCGTLQLAKSDAKAAEMHAVLEELGFPGEWVRPVTREQAGALAGWQAARGGVFFPGGLRVRPHLLCAALLGVSGIVMRAGRAARLDAVPADAPGGRQWRVLDEAGEVLAQAEVVVAANAAGAARLLRDSGLGGEAPQFFGQKRIAGQISLVPETAGRDAGLPRCVVAGDGYVLPPVEGRRVAGSTYVHGAAQAAATAEGHALNLERAARLLPGLADGTDPAALEGWAGWRAVLPGRLPVMAELPDAKGVWVASGYASRGLTWSALAGDLIAASLEGEPLMLERDLLRQVTWR